MILIVDSGATKADWIALDEDGNRLFTTQTLGLSPEVINKEEALERLEARFDIYNNRKEVTNLYFYGAGCGTDRMKTYMTNVFTEFFPNAEVSVKEDTYAAAYATNPNNDKAIICILGTGSNCSYFDGEELQQKVQSLGYIAMDDCSGNRFGRDLVRAYFFNKMPEHLAKKFEAEYNLDADVIKHNLYKEPNPNAYLATFAKFLIQNKEEPFIKEIIVKAMQVFVDNYITQYENAREIKVHFVGSIAYYLKAELAEVLGKNGLSLGNVLRRPIDGLIEYHEVNKTKAK
jgi:N-acetylglucosamine kinase-like BadF-type ATPase